MASPGPGTSVPASPPASTRPPAATSSVCGIGISLMTQRRRRMARHGETLCSMSSTGVALRHSHDNRHFITNNTPSYGKQRPRPVDHNLAGREMRFVGHTVGNLGLAPCSTGPSPSHLGFSPGRLGCLLANRTIGEATSLSPGLFHSHHQFPSHWQGATSSWDRRRLLEDNQSSLAETGCPRKTAW